MKGTMLMKSLTRMPVDPRPQPSTITNPKSLLSKCSPKPCAAPVPFRNPSTVPLPSSSETSDSSSIVQKTRSRRRHNSSLSSVSSLISTRRNKSIKVEHVDPAINPSFLPCQLPGKLFTSFNEPSTSSSESVSTSPGTSNVNENEILQNQEHYNCGAIKEVRLKNFRCFDDLTIKFSSEFTILHGNTLTGKTTIIEAIQIGLGLRASPEVVKVGCEMAAVKIILNNKSRFDLFNTVNIDSFEPNKYGEEIVLDREIHQNGKSTHTIKRKNGENCTISELELRLLTERFNIGIGSVFQFCTLDSLLRFGDVEFMFHSFLNWVVIPKGKILRKELKILQSLDESSARKLEMMSQKALQLKRELEIERQKCNGIGIIYNFMKQKELDSLNAELAEQIESKKEFTEQIQAKQAVLLNLPFTTFNFMNHEYSQILAKHKYKGNLVIDFQSGKLWFNICPHSSDDITWNKLSFLKAQSDSNKLSSAADFFAASCFMVLCWKYLPPCTCIMDCIDRHVDRAHVQQFWENVFQLTEDYDCKNQFIFVTSADNQLFSQNKFRNFVLPPFASIAKLANI